MVIDHLNGEYSFLVHLQRGSVTIREGEFVKRGEPIGRVGNSGSSTHPHLHYQLGDSPEYTDCNGLPLYFHRFRLVTGAERRTKVARSFLSADDIVENK